jgi:hypothetical protein
MKESKSIIPTVLSGSSNRYPSIIAHEQTDMDVSVELMTTVPFLLFLSPVFLISPRWKGSHPFVSDDVPLSQPIAAPTSARGSGTFERTAEYHPSLQFTGAETHATEEGQKSGVATTSGSSLLWLIALVPVSILVALGVHIAIRHHLSEASPPMPAPTEDDNAGYFASVSREAAAAMGFDCDNPMWTRVDDLEDNVDGDDFEDNVDGDDFETMSTNSDKR